MKQATIPQLACVQPWGGHQRPAHVGVPGGAGQSSVHLARKIKLCGRSRITFCKGTWRTSSRSSRPFRTLQHVHSCKNNFSHALSHCRSAMTKRSARSKMLRSWSYTRASACLSQLSLQDRHDALLKERLEVANRDPDPEPTSPAESLAHIPAPDCRPRPCHPYPCPTA